MQYKTADHAERAAIKLVGKGRKIAVYQFASSSKWSYCSPDSEVYRNLCEGCIYPGIAFTTWEHRYV